MQTKTFIVQTADAARVTEQVLPEGTKSLAFAPLRVTGESATVWWPILVIVSVCALLIVPVVCAEYVSNVGTVATTEAAVANFGKHTIKHNTNDLDTANTFAAGTKSSLAISRIGN